jgi:Spy/CpxP family protein refolding chaperone
VGLNLTDDQKTKVKAIGTKYQPELMKLRQEQRTATDRRAVQQQITALNQKIMEEVKAVLTPEQIKQLPPPGRRRQQQ